MKNTILIIFIYMISLPIYAQKDEPIYSFFTAGHVYGNPNNPHYGLHYPFVDFIPSLNANTNIEFGDFTGDIVVHPTADYWDAAQTDMDLLNMPLHLAAGNHDMGEEFVNRFGDYYYSFIQNNDLFIVLTPSLNQWNIIDDQLDFLTNTLESNYNSVDNIFIFLHELIWWSPTNEYQDVIINYIPHYPGSTNFDAEIKPLLLSYPNPITIYAGDVGATSVVSFAMYHQYENITLIASGMGNGTNDNIIITDVYTDYIHHNLDAINGNNPNALGIINDYDIVSSTSEVNEIRTSIFPNPANQFINIQVSSQFSSTNQVYGILLNSTANKIDEFVIKESTNRIDIEHLLPGIYFILIKNSGLIIEKHKLIIY